MPAPLRLVDVARACRRDLAARAASLSPETRPPALTLQGGDGWRACGGDKPPSARLFAAPPAAPLSRLGALPDR